MERVIWQHRHSVLNNWHYYEHKLPGREKLYHRVLEGLHQITQVCHLAQMAILDHNLSMTYGPAASIPQTIQPQANMPQAWLTIRLPQAGQQTYRIEKSVVNIGRQLTNDIIVEDKRVSRNHAQIKFQPDGQFAIFDLGSTNGITINNIPHLRHQVLRNGDRFTIGSYDFYFERR